MIDINNFDSISIGLASPRQIRHWSHGEVTKPETINYRTLKPEAEGLFCQKIFGPVKDWECACGKYKRIRYKGIICERCGVEVTRSKVRRERMGHIDLAAPVSHIWFFKGVPSRIGYMLDIAPKQLEKVLYFAASIVVKVDEEKRAGDLDSLQDQVNGYIDELRADNEQRALELKERMDRRIKWLEEGDNEGFTEDDLFYIEDLERDRESDDPEAKRELTDADKQQAAAELRADTDMAVTDMEKYTEESIERLTDAWTRFKSLKGGDIEDNEQLFREMRDRFASPHGFGEYFEGGMGASAIRDLLAAIDLDEEIELLRETIATSKGQRQSRALKRLKVASAFRRSDNRPEWMVLDAVPVIPPELRPMVQLDGGRFATSDLNDLYRRVINRNNRLKRLLDLGAPEIIVSNEKRMLQEAVDALFDNGRRGRAVTGPGNRPLKSLSDMLKGKQGRFRQNLLGKRVDYSGRSVIVAGPELSLHQCGLPKLMALELFKPFIMSRLVERRQVQNIKAAKKLVDSMVPEVWDVLEEVISEHPVLLNRAPTLHRLGIQAFEPVLVEGKAIQIHPLVCTAFNADFDGDQMAVHLPLSVEAQSEARILMLSANNILSPAHGRPIATPSQDMVLGLYYLTYAHSVRVRKRKTDGPGEVTDLTELFSSEKNEWRLPRNSEAFIEGNTEWTNNPFKELGLERPRVMRDFESVISALDHRLVGVNDVIEMRDQGDEPRYTTVGRVIFNHEIKSALGELVAEEEFDENPFPEVATVLTKRAITDFLQSLVNMYGATAVSQVLDRFKELGFHYASRSGITIGKNDIVIPPTKEAIIGSYEDEVEEVDGFFERGEMSVEERHEEIIKIWERATDHVASAMEEYLFRLNPIFMMANSGARGSFKQIRQLAGMRGCMNNPKGETIERPIKSNFMEGLSVLEYFISTHGARKGLADTALKTADSGYLTRRLVDVSQDVIVRDYDCGSDEGIDGEVYRDGSLNLSMPGRVALGPAIDRVTGEIVWDPHEDALEDERLDPVDETDERTQALLTNRLSEVMDEKCRGKDGQPRDLVIQIRSALKCRSSSGVCGACYGIMPATGRVAEIGDAVGIIAAQSIGEPGTQLTMRTFHTGGVAGADITHGLPRVVELFEARKPKALAIVAPADGWIRIEDDEDRPGAANMLLVESEYMKMEDAGTGATRQPVSEHSWAVPKRTQIIVNDGDYVEAGTLMTIGSAHPPDILNAAAGMAISLEGAVKKVTKGRDGFMTVVVNTDDGKKERYLRLPRDRPAPAIEPGMYVTPETRFLPAGFEVERSTKTELYLVREVQNVYRSQGVDINDKHIEVIVRQMLKKVKVMEPGGTGFLPGQMVDKPVLYRENARATLAERDRLLAQREAGEYTGSDKDIEIATESARATMEPLILGITKASLATESFLSAASFQETTKVLTDAALEGKTDHLKGLKENVIIGKLIPAATGLKRYRNLEIEAVRRAPALLEFDLDDPFATADEGLTDADDILGLGDSAGTFSFEPEFEPEPESAE